MEKNREPILLNKNTIALLLIFTKTDDFEDIFTPGFEKWVDMQSYKPFAAAEQFISQLRGYMSLVFMVALHKKLEEYMKSELERCGCTYEDILNGFEKIEKLNKCQYCGAVNIEPVCTCEGIIDY